MKKSLIVSWCMTLICVIAVVSMYFSANQRVEYSEKWRPRTLEMLRRIHVLGDAAVQSVRGEISRDSLEQVISWCTDYNDEMKRLADAE